MVISIKIGNLILRIMRSGKNPNPNNGGKEEFLHPLSANLPFTQCFKSARQAALLRYSCSKDRDLYVAGDLYDNEVLTPAVIVVPRRRVSSFSTPNLSPNL